MKDVTERLEGEAPTRRVFQQQLFMTLAVSTVLCSVQAAPQGPEALGSKLTPLGGEIAASASGDIPAWTQPGQQDEGWSYGQVRGEHWKFKGDKPLYSIDANNLAQHSSKLSPGQVELFKRIPGYRMDVYPTRRTCSAPDFVVENTRQNVGFAKLDAAGLALDEAHVPGIPFPMPSTGAEVMWNMKMRYRGVGVEIPRTISGISPRKGGEWLRQSTDTFFFTPWGEKGECALLVSWPPGECDLLQLPRAGCSGRPVRGTDCRGRRTGHDLLLLPRPAPRAANAVVLLRCATDRPG